jgi:sigma-B regulation protein RsbU (phosphoserine phosphatase)
MVNAKVASLCRPARIIAGDMCDFGLYAKSKLNVGVLGDVSGKGAPAALYAALTSGVIRSLMERELDSRGNAVSRKPGADGAPAR